MTSVTALRRSWRKPLFAVSSLICTLAFAAFTTPSYAEPTHHRAQHARGHHGAHTRVKAKTGAKTRAKTRAKARAKTRAKATSHRVHRKQVRRQHRAHRNRTPAAAMANFRNANASLMQPQASLSGGSSLVAEARRYIGRNPTGRSSLWCARFMNMVLERSGHRGTGSDMARSFASYGRRVSGPQVGAIAVISRGRRGGHVGVVSGVDAKGNPIIVSGNHGRRVAEASYPKSSVYAYVTPN
jgi:uncharacterized protein (TIGR02594 family)